MSTRCFIGYETDKGVAKAIYSHYDGYPSGVGKILFEHYQDLNKIKDLIALGDISYLGELVAPLEDDKTHSFKSPTDKVTVAYHRDRGEELNPAINLNFTDKDKVSSLWVDYIYIYTLGNKWVFSRGRNLDYKDLTKEAVQ